MVLLNNVMEEKETIQMREVKFLAPIPLINWLEQEAKSNGIDGEQFINALLYAVWANYLQNKKNDYDAQKELQTPPKL